jgi:hypothetical protein
MSLQRWYSPSKAALEGNVPHARRVGRAFVKLGAGILAAVLVVIALLSGVKVRDAGFCDDVSLPLTWLGVTPHDTDRNYGSGCAGDENASMVITR